MLRVSEEKMQDHVMRYRETFDVYSTERTSHTLDFIARTPGTPKHIASIDYTHPKTWSISE